MSKGVESEVIPMHTKILTAEELRETSEYVESLSSAPDSTNGAELIREINEE